MKTTMLMRPIANPRRTRLAQLADAVEPTTVEGQPTPQAPEASAEPAEASQLPNRTANPRRTTLDKLPTS
jgi:hypothetical protein